MNYFLLALFSSIILTLLVKKISVKLDIVDKPDTKRKLHKKAVPLLGGVAIFLSFWLVTGYLIFFTQLIGKHIHPIQLLSVFFASLLLIIVGVIDDIKQIKALPRLIVSVLSAGIVIIGGVGLDGITNPFGGTIGLDFWVVNFGQWGDFLIVADLLVFFWLIGMTNTVKILDGLDGLATGIIGIGAMMIFFLASTSKFYQSDVRLIALVLTGACLGFLIFNFHPAKIYLGESGGLFLGFILAVLAVIAGGKIATTLLVMAIPILDLILVIYRRIKNKQAVFEGDRKHLHFRLIDHGISHRKSVIFLYAVAFCFGITTLILPSKYKIVVLLTLFILFLIGERYISKNYETES